MPDENCFKERREGYVVLEKEVTQLQVMLGNLVLSVDRVDKLMQHVDNKLEERNEIINDRFDKLEKRVISLEATRSNIKTVWYGITMGIVVLWSLFQEKIKKIFGV